MKHGATGKGSLYEAGCRCAVCMGAHNAKHRELRAKRAARRPEDNPLLWHGKLSTYKNHGCRCEACARAGSEANKRRPSRAVRPDRRVTQ